MIVTVTTVTTVACARADADARTRGLTESAAVARHTTMQSSPARLAPASSAATVPRRRRPAALLARQA